MKKHFVIGCLSLLAAHTFVEGYGAKPPEEIIPHKRRVADQQMAPQTQTPAVVTPAIDYHSRFQIGANYTYAFIRPHEHTTFHGGLGGAQALYEYRPASRFYGGGKLTWREGNTHGSAGKRSLFYFDAQERLGYTFASSDKERRLTLFSGFGYKHLGHKFDPKEGSSIKFKYNEIYIPVGALGDYAFNRWFAMGLGLTWMPQVYPTVKIVPLKGARWVLHNKIANFYAEMPITFTLTKDKSCTLILNPSYEYWQDGRSTAKTATGVHLGLPGNTYNFWGIDLNFAYSF